MSRTSWRPGGSAIPWRNPSVRSTGTECPSTRRRPPLVPRVADEQDRRDRALRLRSARPRGPPRDTRRCPSCSRRLGVEPGSVSSTATAAGSNPGSRTASSAARSPSRPPSTREPRRPAARPRRSRRGGTRPRSATVRPDTPGGQRRRDPLRDDQVPGAEQPEVRRASAPGSPRRCRRPAAGSWRGCTPSSRAAGRASSRACPAPRTAPTRPISSAGQSDSFRVNR